jgi:hemoglobin
VSVPATQSIADWLAKNGLERYAPAFADNDIDVSVLFHLTDADLEKIGVSLDHRRKMLASIAELGPKLLVLLLREELMATGDVPSLYERLGGVYSIATVIDDFIDRIMVDPRLNANPRVDEAHHRVPPAGFKYLVTEMVCWATGGPQKYTGRSMKDSHQHLMITATEWEAFLDDLQQTLDKFKVPQAEQTEIKAIIASTRADIVV